MARRQSRSACTATCLSRMIAPPQRSTSCSVERSNDMKDAILKVGDGRGFVVALHHHVNGEERVIITAAHCLPKVPPPHPARYLQECTYGRLLGPLGGKRTVWAECLFADVMAD